MESNLFQRSLFKNKTLHTFISFPFNSYYFSFFARIKKLQLRRISTEDLKWNIVSTRMTALCCGRSGTLRSGLHWKRRTKKCLLPSRSLPLSLAAAHLWIRLSYRKCLESVSAFTTVCERFLSGPYLLQLVCFFIAVIVLSYVSTRHRSRFWEPSVHCNLFGWLCATIITKICLRFYNSLWSIRWNKPPRTSCCAAYWL